MLKDLQENHVRIGMTVEEVVRLLGAPDRVDKGSVGKARYLVWNAGPKPGGNSDDACFEFVAKFGSTGRLGVRL
jgi:hypothetical protein